MKKILVLAIMFLFLGISIIPSTAIVDEEKNYPTLKSGNIFYVGGSGPGNYTKIQDAIDDASDGDTVYVYDDSSPYYENLTIKKLITIKGEDKETTIIDGTEVEDNVINIFADNVNILDFTIQRYCNNDSNSTSLIYIQSNHNNISDNILKGNVFEGISVFKGDFNIIANNIINNNFTLGFSGIYCNNSYIFNNVISVNGSGILLTFANGNKIIDNTIQDCGDGIVLGVTSDNYIYGNLVSNNEFGGIQSVFISENNNITMNEISYNRIGIILTLSKNDMIIKNNFIKNKRNAFFLHSQLMILLITKELGTKPFIPKILWNDNYWYNKIGPGPKLIFGKRGFLSNIPWINFDWNPAKEPYDI
jgi:parallel beta-helix repeat protein